MAMTSVYAELYSISYMVKDPPRLFVIFGSRPPLSQLDHKGTRKLPSWPGLWYGENVLTDESSIAHYIAHMKSATICLVFTGKFSDLPAEGFTR